MPNRKSEEKLDDSLDDTFPASDPPSNTPVGGTKKSREMAEAHESHEAADVSLDANDTLEEAPEATATPTADREGSEKAAG